MPSNIKNKKREKSLLIFAGSLVILTIGILFMNSRKTTPSNTDSSENLSNKSRQTAQEILRDLSVLEKFFTEKKLEKFEEYAPIQKPDLQGRENPFDTF